MVCWDKLPIFIHFIISYIFLETIMSCGWIRWPKYVILLNWSWFCFRFSISSSKTLLSFSWSPRYISNCWVIFRFNNLLIANSIVTAFYFYCNRFSDSSSVYEDFKIFSLSSLHISFLSYVLNFFVPSNYKSSSIYVCDYSV